MHIERAKLASLAWYRLTKVVFFVALTLLAIGSILVSLSEPAVGFVSLIAISLLAEVLRQLFYYVVTGEFLNSGYKKILFKVLKVIGVVGIGVLVLIMIAKGINKIRAIGCESELGPNGIFQDGICGCVYGFTLEDNVCVSNEEMCRRTLGEHSSLVFGNCKCEAGYGEINGKCEKTNDICARQFGNAEGVPGLDDKCKCKSGYSFNEDKTKCIKISAPKPSNVIREETPPQLSERDKCKQQGSRARFNEMSNVCECTYSYVKINGVCQEPPYCGSFGHYDENKGCVCNFGYKRVGDTCLRPDCPSNSSYNSDTNKCQCNAGNLVRDGECISAILLCGITGKYNTVTEDCVSCDPGSYVKGRDCVRTPSCGLGGDFNPDIEACVCRSGYSLDKDGTCSRNLGF